MQVSRIKPGQRVASAFSASCGGCFSCQHELTCRCEHQQARVWPQATAFLQASMLIGHAGWSLWLHQLLSRHQRP